jgi:UMF1 family MFS transporter
VADPSSRGDPKVIAAWCLYDWANSAFNTLVVTFVYSTYFAQTFADNPGRGTALWSRGIIVSAVIVAVVAPFAGVLADRGDRRKYLFSCTLVCCLMTAALTFVHPGQVHAALIAIVLFVVANVAFEIGLVFYNSFLPNIVSEDRIGRVSSYGWGLGYAGGLVCLALALPFATLDPPLLGISSMDGFNVRVTNLLVGAWFLVFSVPFFLLVRDSDVYRPRSDIGTAFVDLRQTFSHLCRHRQIRRFLVARLIYNDGLVTIFAFGGIYAAGTFGFTLSEVIVFGIALNVVAGAGAWIFGSVDDRLGGKTTVMISLVFLALSTVLAAFASDRFWLWVAGVGIGFFLGPTQSASRSLMGRFVPKQHESEFFGFFAFSGKVTAFTGPLLLGVLSDVYSQRVGVFSVTLFFIVGGALLMTVDEHEGLHGGAR